jgi:hypothetical protein
VLNNLSAQIRGCYEHADGCARKAAAQTDPKLKQDYLDLERRWLLLAKSYDLTGRLADFSAEAKRRTVRPDSVYYALHIHRRDGHQLTEYNRHDELPKLGTLIPVTLSGAAINVRVLNVISSPARAFARSVHSVYAVEV